MKITCDMCYQGSNTKVSIEGDKLTRLLEHLGVDIIKMFTSQAVDISEFIMYYHVEFGTELVELGYRESREDHPFTLCNIEVSI